ncbi:tetratricopeptide repeat protein [Amycolatopsis sp. NPDC049691]|uniref:SEL1-like repeat protein n=1 Tax=Amycolatopsis sp. NPDC049691 TaxID=3155155 RepID=UPI00343B54D0
MGKQWLRPPSQRLVAAVLVGLLVFAAGLALVQKWQGAAWWLVAAAAALAAVVSGIGPVWQRAREQNKSGRAVIRRSVSSSERTIGALSHRELRIHTAVIDVPYLPRSSKEREVAEHLRARRPVLLVGASMVGKTRLAATVVEEVLPEAPVLLPDSPTALSDLDKADILIRNQVIWLDDLERFLSSDGISAGLMRRLSASNWLVATLRANEWDKRQPTNQLRPPEWDVLCHFEVVTIDRERDRPTEEDLCRAFPDQDVRERVTRIGIGEYAAAAQFVRNRLEAGPDASPTGYALVVGAANWSRVGTTQPVPEELLPKLALPHLNDRQQADLADEDKYSAALTWATQEINPTVSLLESTNRSYRVYDYALELLSKGETPIPLTTWQHAIDLSDDQEELTSIGYQAEVTHTLSDIAEQAWRKAVALGSATAMFSLGFVSNGRGELAEAEHWYRQAADNGHTDAMNNLGLLLKTRGELDEGERWYRQAADNGHTLAAYNLGTLSQQRGDLVEAEQWYRQAVEGDSVGATVDADTGANAKFSAMNNLGIVHQLQGDLVEAEHWYRQAADVGHTGAMNNLGVLFPTGANRSKPNAGTAAPLTPGTSAACSTSVVHWRIEVSRPRSSTGTEEPPPLTTPTPCSTSVDC